MFTMFILYINEQHKQTELKMEITETIFNVTALIKRLKTLSLKYGGAWTFSRIGFTNKITFIQFKNPSSVPDEYIERTNMFLLDYNHGIIGHKGIIKGFTNASIIREDNRTYSAR